MARPRGLPCAGRSYASLRWPARASPIEAKFGLLRTFVMGNSSHSALARNLWAYLRWRNANARHPDILTAQ